MTDKQLSDRLLKYRISYAWCKVRGPRVNWSRSCPIDLSGILSGVVSEDHLRARLRILIRDYEADQWLKKTGHEVNFVGSAVTCSNGLVYRTKHHLYDHIWKTYCQQEDDVYTVITDHGTITTKNVSVKKDENLLFTSLYEWWDTIPRGKVIGDYVKLSDGLVHHSTKGLWQADHDTIKLLWEASKCDQ